jgi:hypothetical protein
MPGTTTCPDLGEYRRLASGQLSAVEKEALLEHLEGCDTCTARLNMLPEEDTLVGLIRQGQTIGEGVPRETIARMVERLSKPCPPAPVAPVTFACPACGKGVKAKGEMIGKKVKCPHCKQVVCATLWPPQDCFEPGRQGARGGLRGRERPHMGHGPGHGRAPLWFPGSVNRPGFQQGRQTPGRGEPR